ncbi:flagellin N-terminal helical domain-containing protein [Methylobacterium planeticum]|uniref:Flagellin n=1 Tax=Methylobacterium planeticum TaxID=2615211 RepID=A0A6N6MX50_9HYPH|nr:flagellin [Methylobacterium planeticum]KAB1076271.1 hypothetical protein F6X51_01670 [Methylobacterium planeticum]
MSSGITLSAATRQNLLSLQDTASLLSTTQSRLSTGKKVNTALDNPTNFFTSQSLTARSSDLSSLLDGISNGVQAIQAANQGISSIQKLIDTAKSTAQQALADKTGGTGAVLGGTAAQVATVAGSASYASLNGSTNGTQDLSSLTSHDASIDISLDGGVSKTTIRLDATTLKSVTSDLTKVTSDQIISAINGQIQASSLSGKVVASQTADGKIALSGTATGSSSQIKVNGSANATRDIGFGISATPPTAVTVTAGAALAANTDFSKNQTASLTVFDGNKTVNIDLSATTAVDNSGKTLATNPLGATAEDILAAVNKKLADAGSTITASFVDATSNKTLRFTSQDVGPDTQLSVIAGAQTAGGATGLGFSTFTPAAGTAGPATTGIGTRVDATAGTKSSIAGTANLAASYDLSGGQSTVLTVGDGTNSKTITINAANLGKTTATTADITTYIQAQLDGGTAVAVDVTGTAGNKLTFQSKANNVNITVTDSADTLGLLGTRATTTGAAAVATPNVDLTGGKAVTFSVGDGTNTKSFTVDATSLDKNGVALGTAASQAKLIEAINVKLKDTSGGAQAIAASASINGNAITFSSDNAKSTSGPTPSVTASVTNDTVGVGFGTKTTNNGARAGGAGAAAAGVSGYGRDASDGSSFAKITSTVTTPASFAANTFANGSFSLTLGSGQTKTITLDSSTLTTTGVVTQQNIADAINSQISADTGLSGKVKASFVNNNLTIQTTAFGSDQKLTLKSAGTTDIGLGIASSGTTFSAQGTDVGGGKGASSTRSTLADQFNKILQQITQQAQDTGYNGVNLLYRTSNNAADNTLHITFNEKGTSALDIAGVRFDAVGLGLNAVSNGFQSDADVNAALTSLNAATSTLRTQSSTFGSNLSVVQNRQDFTKKLTTILDTGAANLTNADLNEEAANSQALSTRNSLAISALSLANQSQQGILQLLR